MTDYQIEDRRRERSNEAPKVIGFISPGQERNPFSKEVLMLLNIVVNGVRSPFLTCVSGVDSGVSESISSNEEVLKMSGSG